MKKKQSVLTGYKLYRKAGKKWAYNGSYSTMDGCRHDILMHGDGKCVPQFNRLKIKKGARG